MTYDRVARFSYAIYSKSYSFINLNNRVYSYFLTSSKGFYMLNHIGFASSFIIIGLAVAGFLIGDISVIEYAGLLVFSLVTALYFAVRNYLEG